MDAFSVPQQQKYHMMRIGSIWRCRTITIGIPVVKMRGLHVRLSLLWDPYTKEAGLSSEPIPWFGNTMESGNTIRFTFHAKTWYRSYCFKIYWYWHHQKQNLSDLDNNICLSRLKMLFFTFCHFVIVTKFLLGPVCRFRYCITYKWQI